MDPFAQVVLGQRPGPKREASAAIVEGRCKDVSPDGVRFTVPDWDGGKFVFGPAPWAMSRVEPGGADNHDHVETPPPPGARVLVVFVGGGTDRPWIVAWWPS